MLPRRLLALSQAMLPGGPARGSASPGPSPGLVPPPAGPRGSWLGQGPVQGQNSPRPPVPSHARPGQSFLGKSCSAQALPGTWLRCPSSGGHRPPPRDRGHPLASSIAQWRGQRVPPCPSPPHLGAGGLGWAHGRAGAGSGCRPCRCASRAGVPAGAAAAATSTQLTQAAARERSSKREMDDKLR